MPHAGNALPVRIADQLTEMIAKHRFQPGDKLPNELELADELRVSRTTLREALRLRYFSPQILEIRSVKEKMGYLYMEVRIEGGERVFAVKDYSRSLRAIDAHRLMVTDVEGNRYVIPDIDALDIRSRRRIEPYLL